MCSVAIVSVGCSAPRFGYLRRIGPSTRVLRRSGRANTPLDSPPWRLTNLIRGILLGFRERGASDQLVEFCSSFGASAIPDTWCATLEFHSRRVERTWVLWKLRRVVCPQSRDTVWDSQAGSWQLGSHQNDCAWAHGTAVRTTNQISIKTYDK